MTGDCCLLSNLVRAEISGHVCGGHEGRLDHLLDPDESSLEQDGVLLYRTMRIRAWMEEYVNNVYLSQTDTFYVDQ